MLTFGLDLVWRRRMVHEVLKQKPVSILDVCTGTGETAVALRKKGSKETRIWAVDFNFSMINKAAEKTDSFGIDFCLADVRKLPFEDNMFDAVTLSFATRNLNTNRETLTETFREICRVLKPDGIFYNLETSQPKARWIRYLFHKFIQWTVLPVGWKLSGSQKGYHYLAGTILQFYTAEELLEILQGSGFSTIQYHLWTFGVVGLHCAKKGFLP